MMNDQTMGVVLGQLRTVLAAIGGLLVARGMVTADGLNEIIGAVVICVPAIWSAWEKIKADQAAAAKAHDALNAGIALANASPVNLAPVSAVDAPAVLAGVAASPPVPVVQVPAGAAPVAISAVPAVKSIVKVIP
jgi:hypothetical protein